MSERASEFLHKYWAIIVTIVAVAAAWGTSTAQIAGIADTNKSILAKLDTVAERSITATADIGNAKTDIADLRGRIHVLEARR